LEAAVEEPAPPHKRRIDLFVDAPRATRVVRVERHRTIVAPTEVEVGHRTFKHDHARGNHPDGSVLRRPEARTWGKYGGLPSRAPRLDELQVTDTSIAVTRHDGRIPVIAGLCPEQEPLCTTAWLARSSSYHRGVGKVLKLIVCTVKERRPTLRTGVLKPCIERIQRRSRAGLPRGLRNQIRAQINDQRIG